MAGLVAMYVVTKINYQSFRWMSVLCWARPMCCCCWSLYPAGLW